MKRVSTAIYVITALFAVGAAAMQPAEQLSVDAGTIAIGQQLFDESDLKAPLSPQ